MAENFKIECPCCGANLVVDREHGDVLSHEKPRGDAKSFDDAWQDLQAGAKRRQDAFDKAFDQTKRLDEVLDKKFEEAKEKAKKDKKQKPRNPFDLE